VSSGTRARGRSRAPLLLAYGTLMRGLSRHRVLGPAATFLGEAHVRGTLLDLRDHPGLVAGAGRVRGELYRLDDPEVLPAVDREEGYNFERRLTAVTRADGRRTRAWIYWYRGPRERARVIPEGDWRNRWR
jgi:gamma-glutamylcyclotransferase (GGCT)/AIG2-like uncharacterized protein YtfP